MQFVGQKITMSNVQSVLMHYYCLSVPAACMCIMSILILLYYLYSVLFYITVHCLAFILLCLPLFVPSTFCCSNANLPLVGLFYLRICYTVG